MRHLQKWSFVRPQHWSLHQVADLQWPVLPTLLRERTGDALNFCKLVELIPS